MSDININGKFFLEKRDTSKERAKKIKTAISTYKEFLSQCVKRRDKAMKDFDKEMDRYAKKIKELQDELEFLGEK